MFVLRNVALIACMQCALQISLPIPKRNNPTKKAITPGEGDEYMGKRDYSPFSFLTRSLFTTYTLYCWSSKSTIWLGSFLASEIVKKRNVRWTIMIEPGPVAHRNKGKRASMKEFCQDQRHHSISDLCHLSPPCPISVKMTTTTTCVSVVANISSACRYLLN